MNVKNKIIIVTGGNGLIGKEIVLNLKSKGATVINAEINVVTDLDKGIINCDVTNPESVSDSISQIARKFGKIDGLVNNAYPRTSDWGSIFEEIKFSSWQKNVDMQMNSVFLMCQESIKHMTDGGSIVNIASIYGVVGNDFSIYEGTNIKTAAAYPAIKGGVINFTRYLASYLGPRNIRVNCVSPGGIIDQQDPKFIKNYEQKVPMKRMGRPSDIAPAITFLLAEESSYITGQNLIVDGGWTAI